MRTLKPVLLFSFVFVVGAALPAFAQYEDSDCAACHEETVAAFLKTGHAKAPGWDGKTDCQSCHGPGDAHIEEGGDLEKIIRPQTLSSKQSSEVCLACHQRQEKHFSARQGIHLLGDVSCIDCHDAHSAAHNMLPVQGAELCSECHQAVTAQFGMPRSHPLGEGGAECASCHNPHASRGQPPGRTGANDACGNCHFEKKGPFLYAHDTMSMDGCSSCHEVHGSTNRHLLVQATQANLCYECHAAGVTPGWHSAPRFLNEKCTACHAAIHGSNSSQFFLED